MIDKSKVFAYYHSLDNKGYHVIVKVNDLNLDNFKNTYLSICNDLGILDYIDRNCIKKTQYTVISFDENIFINDNCFVYNSLENKIFGKRNKKVQHNTKKEEEIGNGEPFLKINKKKCQVYIIKKKEEINCLDIFFKITSF